MHAAPDNAPAPGRSAWVSPMTGGNVNTYATADLLARPRMTLFLVNAARTGAPALEEISRESGQAHQCQQRRARLRALPSGAGGESQRCWQMRGGNRTRNTLAFPTCLAQKRHLWDCVLRGNGIGLAGRRLHSSPKVPLTRSSHLWDCMLRGQRHRSSRSTPPQLAQSALATQLKMRRIQHGACTCSETVSDHIGGGCGLFVGRLGDAQTNTGLSQFLCTPALWVMSPTR